MKKVHGQGTHKIIFKLNNKLDKSRVAKMFYSFKNLLILLSFLVLCVCNDSVTGTSPYCDYNETSPATRLVQKTRQYQKAPTGFFKNLKKTKVITESYWTNETYTTWKLVSRCCEGFKMSTLKLCEPYCRHGCPEHATCVEPNRCQCKLGYVSAIAHTTRNHYCEPICEKTCPEHAYCAEPNVCICKLGYHVVGGQCELSETTTTYETVTYTDLDDSTETYGTKEMSEEWDENERIYLGTTESTLEEAVLEDDDTQQSTEKCPTGYIYYHGECRTQVFSSNEVDCRYNSCGEHAFCQQNGSCVCENGYVWHRLPQNSTDDDETSTEESTTVSGELSDPLCISLEQLSAILTAGDSSLQTETEAENKSWMIFIIIGVGAICILTVGILLILKFLRRERGSIEIKAQNDLCCQYDNKSFKEYPEVY